MPCIHTIKESRLHIAASIYHEFRFECGHELTQEAENFMNASEKVSALSRTDDDLVKLSDDQGYAIGRGKLRAASLLMLAQHAQLMEHVRV